MAEGKKAISIVVVKKRVSYRFLLFVFFFALNHRIIDLVSALYFSILSAKKSDIQSSGEEDSYRLLFFN